MEDPVITDTDRLNFIERHPEKFLRHHKKKWSFIGMTSYPYQVFGKLREAIDHAIKGYPDD